MPDAFEDRHGHLPPELQAGLQEFVSWSQGRLLLTEQHEATPTEPLYHYTDEVALRGILTNQHIWCFKGQADVAEKAQNAGETLRGWWISSALSTVSLKRRR
jgi:hypothetical protein